MSRFHPTGRRGRIRPRRALSDDVVDARRSVALVVPSAVVPHETNVILNPLHAEFRRIEVGAPEPFPVDARLARRA